MGHNELRSLQVALFSILSIPLSDVVLKNASNLIGLAEFNGLNWFTTYQPVGSISRSI